MTRTCQLLLSLVWLLAGAASALTADELMARDVQARGGLDKLKAIQSLRLTGKLRYGSSTELGYRSLVRRPGMLREEATLQGMTAITVCDGQSAWQMTPFGGRRDPERLSQERLQELQDDADLDGPLVDYQQKGNQVVYLGTEDVEGTLAHKLQVTLKDGAVETYYLDPDCFLPIRITTRRLLRGVETEDESDLSDYRLVAGVYIPFAIDSGTPGGEKSSHVIIERAEVNPDLPESLFHLAGGSQ